MTTLKNQIDDLHRLLPDESLTTTQKLELDFEVLSDIGNSLAGHLNLSYSLPASEPRRGFGNTGRARGVTLLQVMG